jgi:dienelactone hydrolase
MSKLRASLLSSVLAASAAIGCADGGSTVGGTAQQLRAPAIHFFSADAEVTRVFLPEQVRVELTGFPPASRVTLHARMPGYASHATFVADAEGSVDVAAQAPEDGTYQGADADGLFWSMEATDATESPGDDVDVDVQAEVGGAVVATASLSRYETDPGVLETEVHDHGLVGVFVTPAAPGPHPALLAFGGSEGGLDWGRRAARHYASLGYSALGIAYFRAPGLPSRLDDVPLEYFGKALGWMKKRPEVKADAIGVVGASRGGELALLLGASFPDVKAVVAHVPSGVIWPGERAGAWTLGHRELSYVPPADAGPVFTKDADGRKIEHDTPMFTASLDQASRAEIDAATTRVEKVHGPVLMLASADDQIWPSCQLAGIAMDRLTKAGHAATFGDDLVCHPEAGHIVGNPGLPTTGLTEMTLSDRTVIALGGTPAGIGRAAREGFERRRAFLAKALR